MKKRWIVATMLLLVLIASAGSLVAFKSGGESAPAIRCHPYPA